MRLRLFRYRILLTCAGAVLGYFAMGKNDLGSTSIFATVLAALAFALGYLMDTVAARLTRIQSGPYVETEGLPERYPTDQRELFAQFTEFVDGDPDHPDDALDSASLSLLAHGYNPYRSKGHDT